MSEFEETNLEVTVRGREAARSEHVTSFAYSVG